MAGKVYEIGRFQLDTGQKIVTYQGERVPLVPKAIDLLQVLAEHAGRVVARDDLVAAVWPDVTVEDSNLAKLVFLLRRELGEAAIETVPRRGYRLAIEAAGVAPHGTNPVAYDLYLQGRYLWNRRPGDVVGQSLECFRRAIELDASFAPAWAGIADVYSTLGSWEAGVLPHAEAQAKAWSYASRALELDPGLVEAHTTRAYTTLHYGWDLAGAERRFRNAIELDAGYAPAHHWYSHCLAAAGRFDDSLEESRHALACDPMNLLLHVHLAWHWFMAGAAAAGLEQAERVVRIDPGLHWGHYFAGWGAEAIGDADRAVDCMRAAARCANDDLVMRAGLARALAAAGDRAAAMPILAHLEARGLFEYEVALVQLALGDRGAALAALERACARRSGWLAYGRVDPRLAILRDEPRFAALLDTLTPITL